MAIPQARSKTGHPPVSSSRRAGSVVTKTPTVEAPTARRNPASRAAAARLTASQAALETELASEPTVPVPQAQALAPEPSVDPAAQLHASLKAVFAQVVHTLPPTATLGEIVDAAKGSVQMVPLLNRLTVRELIDIVTARPREDRRSLEQKAEAEISYDEDGNPMLLLDAGPQIVRRRADVPDGDLVVLRALQAQGPLGESQLTRATRLSGEQIRLIVRSLKTRALVHLEGSGTKCRIKITRSGSVLVRR